MKAYIISCTDADHGQAVTYAESAKKANKYANGDICGCDYIEKRVKRAPQFDQYFPDGPTRIELFEKYGWWLSCSGCGELCTSESTNIADETVVFCSLECLKNHINYFKSKICNADENLFPNYRASKKLLEKMGV